MNKVVAWVLKCNNIFISRTRHQPSDCTAKVLSPTDLDVSLLEYVQQVIIRLPQQQVFSEEIDHLKDANKGKKKSLSRRSGINNLDPYIDKKRFIESWWKIEKVNSTH